MANVLSLTTASRSATGCGSAEGNITAMNELKTLSDRIDLLEARLTFQDVTIETLNETITAHCQKIDALTRRMQSLSARLPEAQPHPPPPPTPPPPPSSH